MLSRLAALLILAAGAAAPAAAQDILGPDAAACRPGSGRDAVLLTVDGFKNRDGTLRVELWPGNDQDFLRNHHELVAEGKAYHRVTVPVPKSGAAHVCVPLPGPGVYAMGAFHSPAGVRKFNYKDDGATFTRRGGTPTVCFGPGLGSTAHIIDEWTTADALVDHAAATALLALRWCGVDD